MSDKELRSVETGPRQRSLFTSEEDEIEAEQERVLAFVTTAVQRHGYAPVTDLVQAAAADLSLGSSRVLQHIFWLAHDLKLHFRKEETLIAPAAARRYLLEATQPPLYIVFNKPVDEALFASVKKYFQALTGDPALVDCDDQIAFARLVARHIRDWKQALESCRHLARQPGFPGEEDIDAGLALVHLITAKLDAFSLIQTLKHHCQAITDLAEEVRRLSDFYHHHGDRWQVLVKWADAFQNSIGEEPATGERMACFKQMITSPRPYARVDDAWQLMETLRPIHERIVARQTRQCRKEAIAAAKVLIEKMQVHLRTHAASQDQSNRSLYALRMQKQLIEKAKTIDRIKHHRQIAEEAFETAWDEILDLG